MSGPDARSPTAAAHGAGASLRRKADDRVLRGQGRFVAGLRRPGTLDVAFVRRPVAHGRSGAIRKPGRCEAGGFSVDDLADGPRVRAACMGV